MKQFVSLSLYLSVSIFTVARAMKPGHTLATVAKAAQEKPTEQKADAKTLLDGANKAPFDMSEAEQEEVAAQEDSDKEVASADNDSMEDASDDEGEDMSDDDSGDDEGGGDNGGDDGGDDGGD
jgi:hypothetical protein